MSKIRLTKEFSFEMAHALANYDGACRNIHGHSYRLLVTVAGTPSDRHDDPKLGMVMDFGDLKRIVCEKIINPFDHALVMQKDDFAKRIGNYEGKLILTDMQPTCENMISLFAELICPELPADIELHHIRLHETATSYAEWYRADNIDK